MCAIWHAKSCHGILSTMDVEIRLVFSEGMVPLPAPIPGFSFPRFSVIVIDLILQ